MLQNKMRILEHTSISLIIFNKIHKYGEFLGPRCYYERNPIVGYDRIKSISVPSNQFVLKNDTMSLGWTDLSANRKHEENQNVTEIAIDDLSNSLGRNRYYS